MRRPLLFVLAAASLAGCATAPLAPSVLVLPGQGISLEQFQADSSTCQRWADQQLALGGTGSPGYYPGDWTVQRRYDIAYQQCMYSKGDQIPSVAAPLRVPPPPAGIGPAVPK